jgi:HemY protein
LKRIEALAAQTRDHHESHIALAQAALEARLWGEARRHLAAIGGTEEGRAPSPRICRLMAELEEAEHNDLPAARMWLARAGTSETQDAAYMCSACGGETASWTSLCPHCRTFDSIEWRLPGRAPTPRLAAAAEMTPPLPVLAPAPSRAGAPNSAEAPRAAEEPRTTGPRFGLAIDDAEGGI